MNNNGTKGELPRIDRELVTAKLDVSDPRPNLKTLFAAELFSQLPDKNQEAIIKHIKSLLNDDER